MKGKFEPIPVKEIVEIALKLHKDPYQAVTDFLNAWCVRHGEKPGFNRTTAKVYTMGYLAALNLEIHPDTWSLRPAGTSWNERLEGKD